MYKWKLFLCLMLLMFLPSLTVQASPGSWELTGSMIVPRVIQSATLLLDGRVLVTGGATAGGGPTATAELYDPVTGLWSLTGSMAEARSRHTATLLFDGRVLVAGGRNTQGEASRTAELYDPLTGSWTATDSLGDARTWAAATRMLDGRVLITGGLSADWVRGPANNSAEIYDPATGRWTETDHMVNARYGHQATLLADGRVLVTGGAGQEGDCIYKVTAEIYDPRADRWHNAAPMATARGFQAAARLQDGRILLIGGLTLPATCNVVTAAAEAFDVASGTWQPMGDLVTGRGFLAAAAVLADGRVLVAGGRAAGGFTATAELFDPTTGQWGATGNMTGLRGGHTLTVLTDGRILAAGGDQGQGIILNSAEIYTP